MKRIAILFSLLFAFAISGNAQITYTPVYPTQPSVSYQAPAPSRPQPTTEYVRVTAYYQDVVSKEVYKAPVKIAITSSSYGVQIKIVEKYVSYGVGGSWEKVYNSGNVQECSSYLGGLDEYFMFKVFAGGQTYYFDL